MSSIDTAGIDPTKPEQGAAYTANVRANFAEIIVQLINAGGDIDVLVANDVTLQSNIDTLNTIKQPLDATLTALAALSTAADKLVYATGVDAFSTTNLTVLARSLLDDVNQAAMQITLGLVPGTNVQAQDAALQSIAALGTVADRLIYTTGVNVFAETTVTSFIRTLLDDINAATAKITLAIITAATGSMILPSGTTAQRDGSPAGGYIRYNTSTGKYEGYYPTPDEWLAFGGNTLQVVNTQTGAVATATSVIPNDDTIPQNTEGGEFMTLAITPTSASNLLKIEVVLHGTESANVADLFMAALFQDSTADALAVGLRDDQGISKGPGGIIFTHYMVAGTTSATTFKVRAGMNIAGTFVFNGGNGTGRKFGGVLASSITITEIAA